MPFQAAIPSWMLEIVIRLQSTEYDDDEQSRLPQDRLCQAFFHSRPTRAHSGQQVHMVGGDQGWQVSQADQAWVAHYCLAGRGHPGLD